MDVFSTKIAVTLIESHTFCLKNPRDLACFVSYGNEFQPSEAFLSKRNCVNIWNLIGRFLDISALLFASKITFFVHCND